jgi:hypothetical protein
MKQTHDDKACRPMPMKIIIAFLAAAFTLATGCQAQQGTGRAEGDTDTGRVHSMHHE